MKKAKSLKSKIRAKHNPEIIKFVIDNKYTLADLSTKTQVLVIEKAEVIHNLCNQHNALIETKQILTIKEAASINASCQLIENVVDSKIAEFNAFLDEKFEKIWKKQDANKKVKKTKNGYVILKDRKKSESVNDYVERKKSARRSKAMRLAWKRRKAAQKKSAKSRKKTK